jgi:hypothetical protein
MGEGARKWWAGCEDCTETQSRQYAQEENHVRCRSQEDCRNDESKMGEDKG